jgi:hypothetical protein
VADEIEQIACQSLTPVRLPCASRGAFGTLSMSPNRPIAPQATARTQSQPHHPPCSAPHPEARATTSRATPAPIPFESREPSPERAICSTRASIELCGPVLGLGRQLRNNPLVLFDLVPQV